VTALSRLTMSWPGNIIATAREKKDLTAQDLDRPDQYTRSREVSKQWAAYNFTGPLWRSILWAYKGSLSFQWFLCITSSALGFLPHLITLQLLRVLEIHQSGEPIDLNTWMLVPLLTVTLITQAVRPNNPTFTLHS